MSSVQRMVILLLLLGVALVNVESKMATREYYGTVSQPGPDQMQLGRAQWMASVMRWMISDRLSVEFSIIGKPTEQSSTYGQNHQSSKAVDGNTPYECVHTKGGGGESDPWWRVDFEEDHCISTITIINRLRCCSERLTGAVSRAGQSTAITNNTICGTPVTAEQAAPLGGTIQFKCDPPVRARYVTVDIPTAKNEFLQLCEVTVTEFPLVAC